jgi:tRNA(Arg) A34 adenosine deaminase TadA
MTGFMQQALQLARSAAQRGEVPVGAIVTHEGEVIGASGNTTYTRNDPTGHAEIEAMRQAAQILGTAKLTNCDLWVTLEPCTMCAGAISMARIKRLYFGARDPKGGAVESGVRFYASDTCHHAPEIYSGICETECAELLTAYFAARRD